MHRTHDTLPDAAETRCLCVRMDAMLCLRSIKTRLCMTVSRLARPAKCLLSRTEFLSISAAPATSCCSSASVLTVSLPCLLSCCLMDFFSAACLSLLNLACALTTSIERLPVPASSISCSSVRPAASKLPRTVVRPCVLQLVDVAAQVLLHNTVNLRSRNLAGHTSHCQEYLPLSMRTSGICPWWNRSKNS